MPRPAATITAIELGTSAIKLVQGEPRPDNTILIHGGLEFKTQNKVVKGEIANYEGLSESLAEALNKLEGETGHGIQQVCLAVTGSHIGAVNAQSSLPITSPDHIITEDHARDALAHAEAHSLPLGKRALEKYQRPFLIDGSRRARDPRGMVGNQLSGNVLIIYGNDNAVQTSERLLEDVLGVIPYELAFSGTASFLGLGLKDATAHGVLVIDIGAGVTEYALFYDEACLAVGQITVGTEQLANDLAIGLRLPIGRCRDLIRQAITARRTTDDPGAAIKVETNIGHPARQLRRTALETIVETRLSELFAIVKAELAAADVLPYVGERLVLCGGGALIPDICALAESYFNVPAAVGRPAGVVGSWPELDNPRMVTPVGLLHHAHLTGRMRDPEEPTFWRVFGNEGARLGALLKKAFRF